MAKGDAWGDIFVTKVWLLIEGGGPEHLNIRFIDAFRTFLGLDRNFHIEMTGGYKETVNRFLEAPKQGQYKVMLIDSEGPLPPFTKEILPTDILRSWAQNHAKAFKIDRHGLNALEKSKFDQIHFMVQMMEAWFIGDVENVEILSKEEIKSRIPQNNYSKKKAPEILKNLDSQIVRKKSIYCDRLLKKIEELKDKKEV